ncbi:hypothetical protein LH128_01874 [Sphingomonas sp. LH128]|nr:hypothetical protein LH128_01874 [Sphingomonas sp. LH128]
MTLRLSICDSRAHEFRSFLELSADIDSPTLFGRSDRRDRLQRERRAMAQSVDVTSQIEAVERPDDRPRDSLGQITCIPLLMFAPRMLDAAQNQSQIDDRRLDGRRSR